MSTCTICQDDIDDFSDKIYLCCRQVYHLFCVKRWVQERRSCPICKVRLNDLTLLRFQRIQTEMNQINDTKFESKVDSKTRDTSNFPEIQIFSSVRETVIEPVGEPVIEQVRFREPVIEQVRFREPVRVVQSVRPRNYWNGRVCNVHVSIFWI